MQQVMTGELWLSAMRLHCKRAAGKALDFCMASTAGWAMYIFLLFDQIQTCCIAVLYLIADAIEGTGMYTLQACSFLEEGVVQHALQKVANIQSLH